jgi:hypothetical protein
VYLRGGERGAAIALSGAVAEQLVAAVFLLASGSKTAPAILLLAKPPLDIDSFTNFAASLSLVKAAFS